MHWCSEVEEILPTVFHQGEYSGFVFADVVFSLMVICDSNLMGILPVPEEDDAPLIIDPDTPKRIELPLQPLESITRRNTQINQWSWSINDDQLSESRALHSHWKVWYIYFLPNGFSDFVSKTCYHSNILTFCVSISVLLQIMLHRGLMLSGSREMKLNAWSSSPNANSK